jgi:HAE1 family hydrophobic/amphiphilic exporter-1
MNLPEFAVKRSITILMLFSALLLFGVVSLMRLPVELYPNVSFGEISIIVYVRGGIPPTEVETLVTKPIEEAISTVSHLENVLSISKEGESTIVLSFEPGTNMDFAALEVREKFARVKNKLPKEIEKPVIAQFKRSDVPIMILAVTSPKRTTEEIRKVVDEVIKEHIKRINGVANIDVGGGRERKILVEVDKHYLVEHNISLERVISMLSLNNLNFLSGEYKKDANKYLVRVMGEFETIDEIKNIGVGSTPSGAVIRLKDVARVEDSYLDPKTHSRMNVKPVVSLYIQKESTANTIEVAEDINKKIKEIRSMLDEDIELIVTSDQAKFIKKAVNNLKDSLLRGALLIILVLLLFLESLNKRIILLALALIVTVIVAPIKFLYVILVVGMLTLVVVKQLRSILIVTLSIPISVVITFGLMKLKGLSINFMTLFGLALGVGMLVDNSIVVFENILKQKERGIEKQKAAIAGSTEVTLAIIASTLTTVIVFLPMVFVGEEVKLLYGGVAWTVTFALVVSLFVALSVVTLLSARRQEETKTIAWVSTMNRHYRYFLVRALRKRYQLIGGAIGLFIIAFFIMRGLGMEFIGATEQSKFTIFIELPTGAKLDASNDVVREVENILRDVPEVKTASSRVEAWSSKVYVELVPLAQRKRSVSEIIDSLRPHTDKIYPAFIYYEEEQEVGTKEFILDVFGYDYDVLREIAVAMAQKLGEIPKMTDVKIRMREGRPEMGIKVDKYIAALFDLNVNDIAMMVHAQMRGLRATLFHTESKEVETIARIDEKYRRTFEDLHKLVLTTEEGRKVYLDQVSDFTYDLGPSEIWRKNRNRMVQVSGNVGKVPLSKMAATIKETLSSLELPEDYFYRFGGNYPTMIKTNRQFKAVIWLVLALVFIVLASLFESYVQPFIIMMAVPFALIGAVFALYISHNPISMGVFVGMMMLAGIVVNNSIIMVDHINQLRLEKISLLRAVVIGCRDRLRPVAMTTSTTVLGLLPMALDRSEGSNLWSPLAITVIGGLLSSTVLTLFIVPGIYVMLEDIRRKRR